jgi:hypothetical protein
MRLELAIPHKNRINISSPSNPDPRKIKFDFGYRFEEVQNSQRNQLNTTLWQSVSGHL